MSRKTFEESAVVRELSFRPGQFRTVNTSLSSYWLESAERVMWQFSCSCTCPDTLSTDNLSIALRVLRAHVLAHSELVGRDSSGEAPATPAPADGAGPGAVEGVQAPALGR